MIVAPSLDRNRTYIAKVMVATNIIVLALGLLLFNTINTSSVHAVGLIASPDTLEVPNSSTQTSTIDTKGYGTLVLSFNYNAELLDRNDTLQFGWRQVGGESKLLGAISGKNENSTNPATLTDETGGMQDVRLSSDADNGNIELYFINTGESREDTVHISNINIEGSLLEVEPANETIPRVNGENFNTHVGTDYSGLNVGFTIEYFNTVTGVTVELYEGDTLIVANRHNQKLLDLINNDDAAQLSTPFITVPGTYEEEYWVLGTYAWSSDSPRPTSAVIKVTGTNSNDEIVTKSATLTELTEPNDWTFAAILPEIVSTPGFEVGSDPDVVNDNDSEGGGDAIGVDAGTQAPPPQETPRPETNNFSLQSVQFGTLNDTALNSVATIESSEESETSAPERPQVLGTNSQEGTELKDTAVLGAEENSFTLLGMSWLGWFGAASTLIVGWLILAAIIRRVRGTGI